MLSMYMTFGLAHPMALKARAGFRRLGGSAGQGTVEYVGLILLVSLTMVGVLAVLKGAQLSEGKELGELIINKIQEAVKKVHF